jgi:FkbM family methyltransferase
MVTRLKRAARELLGRSQWRRPGDLEPRSLEEQLYAAVARRGDVCFDVGANQGQVSLYLAQLVGESGIVVAFEPVWPVYLDLCRRIQSDPSLKAPIITVPVGLTDCEKDATIQVPDGQFGMGSMAEASAWRKAQPGAAIDSYRATFTTLDSFLAATGMRPPTFIKIDVEGAELSVLRGAAGLLGGGHRPLMLLEVFAPWERAFGYEPWELLSLLLAYGYRFLFVCPDGLVEHLPTEPKPFPPEYEMGYNVLAYSPAAHAERTQAVEHLRAGSPTNLLPMGPPPQPNRIS